MHDYDWLVIGSGFGGSVSALRLSEMGQRVGVLESGRRFADDELPNSTWDVRKYYFSPKLGCKGILRLTVFKDVFIGSGAGVGGGSLGYANTLYRAPRRFYDDPQWAGLSDDWGAELKPHYDTAERMLGVVDVTKDDPPDQWLREFGRELGVDDSYSKTRVGVYFGEGPGVTVADPFFGGEGPERTGCIECGRCMMGCPHGAKNTLVKNYLYLAERKGTEILPERTVVDIRRQDASFDIRHSEYLAEHIPNARFQVLEGADTLPFLGDSEAILGEIEEFLTGARAEREPDRVLATVLFTDICKSTERAAELGDARWRQLLEQHDNTVREQLARHRGRPVKSVGDGFLATFDGPARAIRAARAIGEEVGDLGLEIRAGLHTGECEVIGEDVGGLAVHIAARVMAGAGPGEVLVSNTVKDLVVGSELRFDDRGEHELRGVPGAWRLWAAA